jgi:hypothetical protein
MTYSSAITFSDLRELFPDAISYSRSLIVGEVSPSELVPVDPQKSLVAVLELDPIRHESHAELLAKTKAVVTVDDDVVTFNRPSGDRFEATIGEKALLKKFSLFGSELRDSLFKLGINFDNHGFLFVGEGCNEFEITGCETSLQGKSSFKLYVGVILTHDVT